MNDTTIIKIFSIALNDRDDQIGMPMEAKGELALPEQQCTIPRKSNIPRSTVPSSII
jgi:hypothetical protein